MVEWLVSCVGSVLWAVDHVQKLLRLKDVILVPSIAIYQHDLAVSFDVYVQEATDANYILKRELETGLTQSEQKQLDILQMQVRMLQYKGRTRNGS